MSTPRRYSQVTKAVYERPWAIQPPMLAVIEEIVRLRATGAPFGDDEIEQRIAAAQNGPRRGGLRAQGVSVIPVYGVITQRMNLMSAMSGGTSVEQLTAQLREALADPEVGAIVFDVDSPGGAVEGILELAAEIRASRGQKPMAAVANTTMASAAYWLASQADEVIASPSAQVGSIGIIGVHVDQSEQDKMIGESYTFVTAGEGKADGNSHEPLTDSARADMQAMVDEFYAAFVGDVAKGRGVSRATVTGEWKAQVFSATKAKAGGLVDRVDTLDATVRRLMVKANRQSPASLAALGQVDAPAAIAELMSTLPIHEQLALLNEEGARVAAHYDKRAELRAKEQRQLPEATTEQLAALEALRTIGSANPTDLDTDQPEEAESTPPAATDWRGRAHLDVLEAATRGGYQLPPREVSVQ